MPDIPDFIKPIEESPDRLLALKNAVAELRDMELEKKDIEQQLHDVNVALYKVTRETLPELFASAGVHNIGLDGYGNLPAYTAKLDTEIRASISKDWPEEKRDAAFSWLAEQGAEDLIKATIIVSFDKTEIEAALELRRKLMKQEYDVTMDMSVHHMTLSAWLRERWAEKDLPPNIDTIGGYVGPVVKLIPVKEKR